MFSERGSSYFSESPGSKGEGSEISMDHPQKNGSEQSESGSEERDGSREIRPMMEKLGNLLKEINRQMDHAKRGVKRNDTGFGEVWVGGRAICSERMEVYARNSRSLQAESLAIGAVRKALSEGKSVEAAVERLWEEETKIGDEIEELNERLFSLVEEERGQVNAINQTADGPRRGSISEGLRDNITSRKNIEERLLRLRKKLQSIQRANVILEMVGRGEDISDIWKELVSKVPGEKPVAAQERVEVNPGGQPGSVAEQVRQIWESDLPAAEASLAAAQAAGRTEEVERLQGMIGDLNQRAEDLRDKL